MRQQRILGIPASAARDAPAARVPTIGGIPPAQVPDTRIAAFFALVPAAGSGRRLVAGLPKQYRTLAGMPMLRHAVRALLADARIRDVAVLAAEGDVHAAGAVAGLGDRVCVLRCGGPTRAATVAAGAAACAAGSDSILLVHDAARPCLHWDDLARLLDAAAHSPDGALLAAPLAATVKRERSGASGATVDREGLWEAQTPQAAPADVLRTALAAAPEATDEAQALELAGLAPLLVRSEHPNPKVTTAADWAVAQLLLETHSSES